MKHLKRILSVFMFAIITGSTFCQVAPVKVDLYSNGNKLNADFYKASGGDKYPTLILLHGYPGGEGDQFGLGKKLSSSGINVLVFNFRGTWSSEGTFSFESSMEDIGSAIKFLNKNDNIARYNIDTANIIVAGYSLGGAMALTGAIYNPEIRRIISIAGADESVFGKKMLTDDSFRTMFEQMIKASESPAGPIKFDSSQYKWLSNLDKFDQVKHAESLVDRDILFIGGWQDNNVILEEHILPLYRKLQELNSDKIQICVFDTDHVFGNVRTELTNIIETWIKDKK
jgi:pimeloyl-ACP methyl ester carboxylesterase